MGVERSPERVVHPEAPREIERKFLVPHPPDAFAQYPSDEIRQGYVSLDDGTEVRVRQRGQHYFFTVKSAGHLVREEVETEITEAKFSELWEKTEGRRLTKTRFSIPYGTFTVELDTYGGSLEGLVTAEVEFESPEDAEKFVPPPWFGDEVTFDSRYKNNSLARLGLPEGHKQLVFELKTGIAQLRMLVEKRVSQDLAPVVVAIAGGSASGKTSAVAAELKSIFGESAVVLSIDDYYRGATFMREEAKRGRELNWDHPDALNLTLLSQHVRTLKSGKPVEKPVYDFKSAESVRTEKLESHRVIIVEGLFALHDTVKDVSDIKAFVDIGTHGRILRRLLRDVERTGQKPSDILRYFADVVEPMHEKYVQSTRKDADVVIMNEYRPHEEARRAGQHEIQLKFKNVPDAQVLRAIQAERLSTVVQVDTYYNPRDRNLAETDEALRIREEGGRMVLSYKGPRVSGEFRVRPKFEFEIDEETKKALLSIYDASALVIKKERTLYQLDGVVFSLDQVTKVVGDTCTELGQFLEVRSIVGGANEGQVKNMLARLGLAMSQGTKKSYPEM